MIKEFILTYIIAPFNQDRPTPIKPIELYSLYSKEADRVFKGDIEGD